MKTTFMTKIRAWIFPVIIFSLIIIGGATYPIWSAAMRDWAGQQIAKTKESQVEHHDEASHAGHVEAESLELSPQGFRNLGVTQADIQPLQLSTFHRTIMVPAMVAEKPGRTRINVATPLTGVVDHVHAVTGETVIPSTLLFELRLTHEDLVQSQVDFLKTLGERDVEEREVQRLREITQQGAVAGKTLLERQYSLENLEALLSALRESLRLHGLNRKQLEQIIQTRRLLQEVQIFAPSPDVHNHGEEFSLTADSASSEEEVKQKNIAVSQHGIPLAIHQLNVNKGQSVTAGESLMVLADFREMVIEGDAFERDAPEILRVLENKWGITAIFDNEGIENKVEGLTIQFLSHQIDPQTRTLHFYLPLKNEMIRETTNEEGQRFVTWRYRPGQRLQLLIPVEEWKDQIVVPRSAIAKEGAESYVFVQNGNHFDRMHVHVIYSDQYSAVIANDGSVFPGDVIAMRRAQQMQTALKNMSGGAIDPHAGHSHD